MPMQGRSWTCWVSPKVPIACHPSLGYLIGRWSGLAFHAAPWLLTHQPEHDASRRQSTQDPFRRSPQLIQPAHGCDAVVGIRKHANGAEDPDAPHLPPLGDVGYEQFTDIHRCHPFNGSLGFGLLSTASMRRLRSSMVTSIRVARVSSPGILSRADLIATLSVLIWSSCARIAMDSSCPLDTLRKIHKMPAQMMVSIMVRNDCQFLAPSMSPLMTVMGYPCMLPVPPWPGSTNYARVSVTVMSLNAVAAVESV